MTYLTASPPFALFFLLLLCFLFFLLYPRNYRITSSSVLSSSSCPFSLHVKIFHLSAGVNLFEQSTFFYFKILLCTSPINFSPPCFFLSNSVTPLKSVHNDKPSHCIIYNVSHNWLSLANRSLPLKLSIPLFRSGITWNISPELFVLLTVQ